MKHITDFLKERNLDKSLAADMLSAPGRSGYIGPALTDLLGGRIIDIKDIVPNMRVIKDEDEIELIRVNGLWGNLAHSILQRNTLPGRYDFEVAHMTEIETTKIMLEALGSDIGQYSRRGVVGAKLSGVGKDSAFPHAIGGPCRVQIGDNLVTYAEAYVGGGAIGYICELERTMFMGLPTEKQEKFFEIMVKAQDVAFETYGPGIKCSEVDKAVMQVFKEEGVLEFARHHTGHSSGGLDEHEAPYIDVGCHDVMQPNMVFSCEPGLYVPGLGGFRHSDCVRITEDGAEIMTWYPRDIDALTIIP
jgi:Xaa-Pro aminopeptidase